MSMVCPQCRGAFKNLSQCPKCGVRLHYQPGAAGGERLISDSPPDERWHQTPFGRTVAGLLLASGLGAGMLKLCITSFDLLHKEPGPGGLSPEVGLGLFLGLPALAVLIGATFAGVGRRKGVAYGVIVGLLGSALVLAGVRSGVLTDLSRPFVGDLLNAAGKDQATFAGMPVRLAVVYGMPAVFLLCGLVGGFVGSLVWKPPAALDMPTFAPVERRPMQELSTSGMYRPLPKPEPSVWKGKVAWLRVLVGIGIAFAGAFLSRRIIDVIMTFGEGTLHIESNYQLMLANRMVYGLAMFLGACVAGATTPNGLKQGFVVGLGAGLLQGALMASTPHGAQGLVYVVPFALFLAPLGGWFGCSLMPSAPAPK
jgi:hypothetical protein